MNIETFVPHDGMVAELIRRGLPAEYAHRAAAEMEDHYCDLTHELRAGGSSETKASEEAVARLGDTQTLIKKTVSEYQRRFWCGRWPIVTFFLGPVPLLFLTWVATWVIAFCVLWPLDQLIGLEGKRHHDGVISTGESVFVSGIRVVYLFVLPAIVLIMLSRLARRAALSSAWMGAAAITLAIAAGSVRWGFADPALNATVDGASLPIDAMLLTVGPFVTSSTAQIGQILLPIAVALAIFLRSRQLALRSQRLVIDRC